MHFLMQFVRLFFSGGKILKLVKKKEGRKVTAYCLGDENPKIESLIEEGKIERRDGGWLIFSQEANEGEWAGDGDFIKLDGSGYPYPNARAYFLDNHRHIGGDEYEQLPKPLKAWDREEGMCHEIEYLIAHKGLVINEGDEDNYFSAPLWGDILSARADCMIVFYSVTINEDGDVTDVDFNFVARDEFEKTYDVIG